MNSEHENKLITFLRNRIRPCVSEIEYLEVLTTIIRVCEEIKFFNCHSAENNSVFLPPILFKKTLGKEELSVKLDKSNVLTLCLGKRTTRALVFDFFNTAEYILCYLNTRYGHGLIDFKRFSPIFLEHMLGVDLPFLDNACLEEYPLRELRAFSSDMLNGIEVTNERYYRCLCGDFVLDEINLYSNHLTESNDYRLSRVLDCIRKNGYPYNNQFIVVYNDEMIIRDGEHRWACLYYLYGNIRIPILRLRFSFNYYSFSRFHKNCDKKG